MPRLLINGNKLLLKGEQYVEEEGYIQNDRILEQQFLPCKYRSIKKCGTCKKALQVPQCKLKNISKFLICIGCTEREE